MTLATDARRNLRKRHFDTSAADTALVLTTPTSSRVNPQRFMWVGITYSAVPVHAGILVEIDSGAGATFDTRILLGNANDQFAFFQIDGGLEILNDDAIRVTAPAGGGVITSTISIIMVEKE